MKPALPRQSTLAQGRRFTTAVCLPDPTANSSYQSPPNHAAGFAQLQAMAGTT